MQPIYYLSIVSFLLNIQMIFTVPIDEYPNPIIDELAFNLPSRGYLCDPDAILSENERSELWRMINEFPDQTKNDAGESACKKKGVTVAVALSRLPIYIKISAMGREFNNTIDVPLRLLNNWGVDSECHKAFQIVLASEQRQGYNKFGFYFAAPILWDELNHLFAAEEPLLQQRRWLDALRGILAGARQIVNDRHGTLTGITKDGNSDETNGYNNAKQQFLSNPEPRPMISIWTIFLLFCFTVLASVASTLGILWTLRAQIFEMRHGLPLIRFDNNNPGE